MGKSSVVGHWFPSEIAFHMLFCLFFQVMLNQTSVTEFLLLGVTDMQELQPVLFVIFLATYIVSLAGKGAILMVVISDSRLHSPMYFFLGNLSCLDICNSTVTLPKMLENFLSTHKAISFLGCISQLHYFHFLGSTESMLLAVMGFDRFVAICKPLGYPLIMSHQVCVQMAIFVWVIGFFHALLYSVMTSHLNFCGSNHIHHFFCDIKPLLELACGALTSMSGCSYCHGDLCHWPIFSNTSILFLHYYLSLFQDPLLQHAP